VSDLLNRARPEQQAPEALAAEFARRKLDFATLPPTIRSIMEQAAISTADVEGQVERFLTVAKMAERTELSDEQKRYVLIKAYERYGETITGSGATSTGAG
jgi:hypothetical protein